MEGFWPEDEQKLALAHQSLFDPFPGRNQCVSKGFAEIELNCVCENDAKCEFLLRN